MFKNCILLFLLIIGTATGATAKEDERVLSRVRKMSEIKLLANLRYESKALAEIMAALGPVAIAQQSLESRPDIDDRLMTIRYLLEELGARRGKSKAWAHLLFGRIAFAGFSIAGTLPLTITLASAGGPGQFWYRFIPSMMAAAAAGLTLLNSTDAPETFLESTSHRELATTVYLGFNRVLDTISHHTGIEFSQKDRDQMYHYTVLKNEGDIQAILINKICSRALTSGTQIEAI